MIVLQIRVINDAENDIVEHALCASSGRQSGAQLAGRRAFSAVKQRAFEKTRALCFPRGCSGFKQYPVSFSGSTMASSPPGIFMG
jgi:hypothetical protein